MHVQRLSPKEWAGVSEYAHLVCFDEDRPKAMNTFDYCLVVEDDQLPVAYSTIIEMDSETAYMQHGGAFPSSKGTVLSRRAYAALMKHLKVEYKRITTRIENKNTAMLKFALSEGLLIYGVDAWPDGSVYLHLKFEKGDLV